MEKYRIGIKKNNTCSCLACLCDYNCKIGKLQLFKSDKEYFDKEKELKNGYIVEKCDICNKYVQIKKIMK